MKQKSLYGLIILMSLSLLGIVIAQFLWVKQAITVQQEKFNASVFESLGSTVNRLHREQSKQFMMNSVFPRINQLQSSQSSGRSRVVFRSAQPKMKQNDTLSHQTNRQIQTRIEFNGGGTSRQIFISGTNNQFQIIDQQVNLEDSISKVLDIAKRNEQELMKMFNQISYEMLTRHDPLQKRLDLSNLDDVIKSELQQRGILTNYEFGVYDRTKNAILNFKSDAFDIKKAKYHNPVRIKLFPNDVMQGASPFELIVYFPHITGYLFKSQGWLLVVSIVFTLFILVTFYLTIRMIVNQKKISQIKNDFINNMTHEFKTPIATISLATDSILMPSVLSNVEQTKTFLNIIKEENGRMNSHVERVLQMSMIDKREFSMIKTTLDLHEIINRAVENIRLLAEETGGEVQSELEAQVSKFDVDEIHFTNVIVNLLENALKYAKDNPHVVISTQNSTRGIVISIKDNGIGMTREQQNKIFDKFYRAEGGNVHNVKGFGLGLSYVKAVIDGHGASISVKSKINVGTEFLLEIPYNESDLKVS